VLVVVIDSRQKIAETLADSPDRVIKSRFRIVLDRVAVFMQDDPVEENRMAFQSSR